MTYSIVARDPLTGRFGVAVQTCMFGVGALVPWARPGVGAVASQAIGEPAYGSRCLDAIASGATAADALAHAASSDPATLLRQVGVVAADGTAAAMTGEWCIDHAGHVIGDGFSVQANMMASAEVWPAMAETFLASRDAFPRRLVAALCAGQAAGGDARGVMSAALVVVDGDLCEPWTGRPIDLRVDRSDDPIGELDRLLDASDGFAGFHRAVAALSAGDGPGALAEIEPALALVPGDENMRFVRAGALVAVGDLDRARGAQIARRHAPNLGDHRP